MVHKSMDGHHGNKTKHIFKKCMDHAPWATKTVPRTITHVLWTIEHAA